MRRYTTPMIAFYVKGHDLTETDVYITIVQHNLKKIDLTLRPDTISYDGVKSILLLSLTQEQTSRFSKGLAKVQVNWIDSHGKRNATEIKMIDVPDNLMAWEVNYGD